RASRPQPARPPSRSPWFRRAAAETAPTAPAPAGHTKSHRLLEPSWKSLRMRLMRYCRRALAAQSAFQRGTRENTRRIERRQWRRFRRHQQRDLGATQNHRVTGFLILQATNDCREEVESLGSEPAIDQLVEDNAV